MLSVFAPGRVELLGNHTDYNDGVVLAAALNFGTTAVGRENGTMTAVLESEGFPIATVDLTRPLTPSGTWSDYPVGVVSKLIESGFPVRGFEAKFSSNLPVGAGLSSSAAIEVSTAVFLSQLFGFSLPRMDLALLCKQAENDFAGVNCGILDQVSSVFGQRQHAILLDCRAQSVTQIPFPDGAELLIVHSGVKHALTGGEYNERRAQCFEAARILGVSALRDATSKDLNHPGLSEVVRRRAAHITGENERVFAGVEALKHADLPAFGALLTASHRSSTTNFENSTLELDALVQIAISQPGVFGARLTGGGFGGAIVALVASEAIDRAKVTILDDYQEKLGLRTVAYPCKLGDGAVPES